jgi:3-methyladenine DNA glycosylase AlkD
MARYAIPSDQAYGVAMKDITALGTALGRNHALAIALWATGVYEARMLASFVGDPEQLTPAQMDRWCRDFDNWAFCDAMSFNLFGSRPDAENPFAFGIWHLALTDESTPFVGAARRRSHGLGRGPAAPRLLGLHHRRSHASV